MSKPNSKQLDRILFSRSNAVPVKRHGTVTSSRLNNIMEDWGSSDWSAAIKMMDNTLEREFAGKVNPDTIPAAAYTVAEMYYEQMGWSSAEEAQPHIVSMYMRRKGYSDLLKSDVAEDNVTPFKMGAGDRLNKAFDGMVSIIAHEFGGNDDKGNVKSAAITMAKRLKSRFKDDRSVSEIAYNLYQYYMGKKRVNEVSSSFRKEYKRKSLKSRKAAHSRLDAVRDMKRAGIDGTDELEATEKDRLRRRYRGDELEMRSARRHAKGKLK